MPGFHIIELDKPATYDGGGVHFDLSYRRLRDTADAMVAVRHMSFTLPVKLPNCHAGIEFWNLHIDRDVHRACEQGNLDVAGQHFERVAYAEGEFVVFNGRSPKKRMI